MIDVSMSRVRIIILFIITLSIALLLFYRANPLVTSVVIDGHEFTVDLAMTDEDIRQGLSGTQQLPEGHGMLFVFKSYGDYSFWMPDMNYPLDMIWIDDDRVVHVTENAPPCLSREQCPRYEAPEPTNRVLEVSAGTSRRLGIGPGDSVRYVTP